MKAYELFTGPETHTRGVYAQTKLGESVLGNHPDAVSFCVAGAIEHVYGPGIWACEPYKIKLRDYCIAKGLGSYIDWNDHVATWEDVRNVLKELDI